MKFTYAKTFCAVAFAAMAVAAGGFVPAAHAQVKAASPVTLSSDVKIERTVVDAAGKETTKLFTPKDVAVVPGDNIVFTLLVSNTGAEPAAGFRATAGDPEAAVIGRQRLPRGVGVGGLGVIDEADASQAADLLHAVREAGEGEQA